MFIKKWSKLLSITILCLISINAYAQQSEKHKIIIYGYTKYMPFMDGNGKDAKGLYPFLVKKIFNKAGYQVDFKIMPWKRALKSGMKGKGILAGILKNEERSKVMDYSQHFYEESHAIYSLKSAPLNYNNINDLKAKKIGIITAFSYGQAFNQAKENKFFSVKEAKVSEQNFKQLIRGRLDAVIEEETIATIHLNNLKKNYNILKSKSYILKDGIYIAVAKSLKQQKILDQFNEALAAMKKDGSYQLIIDKFIENIK